MKKNIAYKNAEGKWITLASFEEGQYGPRIGVKMDALIAFIKQNPEGWQNLSVFDQKKKEPF